jgi:nitrate/nitrite transport system substrate-binding protein
MTVRATHLAAALLGLSLACAAVPAAEIDLAGMAPTDPTVIDPATITWVPFEHRAVVPSFKKAKENKLEKTSLKFGMIKLTDCAPIVVAKEMGFFAEEGLNVTIEVQPNWKAVNDRVISMELDGSHMLYGHPMGAAIGFGVSADLIVPYNISINGMGISVSNQLWDAMKAKDAKLAEPGYAQPVSAALVKAVAADRKAAGQEPMKMFMTFPAGSHNMNLRYWLAAGGVNPGFYEGYSDPIGKKGAEVILSVNPPPQMASAMAAGNCDGFCVGEPWNMQVTLKDKTGRLAVPSQYIFDGSPDKVFAVSKQWAESNPNTLVAVTKALIRAGQWLDESKANRKLAVEMLANKDYIAAAPEILAESMLGSLVYNLDGGKPDRRSEPQFNVFYKRNASFPLRSHAVWCLTQFRRWGMIPENKSDAWYLETAERTFRSDIYRTAFAALLKEGKVKAEDLPAEDYQSYPAEVFIDKIPFDPKKPNDYLKKFAIGLK